VSLVEAGVAVIRDFLWMCIEKLEGTDAGVAGEGGDETGESGGGGGGGGGGVTGAGSDKAPHANARIALARFLRKVATQPWILALSLNGMLFAIGLLLCRSSGEEWVDLIDFYVSNFLMTSIGVLQFVIVAWVFGIREYSALMKYRIGLDLGLYLTIVWRFVGPFLMSVMLLAGIVGAITNPVTTVPWAATLGCTAFLKVSICSGFIW
jgi:hypothetical protein